MRIKSVNSVTTILIATVVVLTVASGVWWVSNNTYKAILSEQKAAMENVVSQSMAALDEYIGQTKNMTRTLAAQQSIIDALSGNDPLNADWLFKDLLDNSKGYWAAFAFDKNGKVVAGYNAKGKSMAGADRSTRGYVQAIVQGKADTYVSDKILLSKSGGGILIFAAATVVYDHTGELVGGVGLFPKWENFTSRFIDPIRIATNGYGFMLDSKGRMIAHAVNKKTYLKDYSHMEFAKVALEKKKGTAWYEWEGREKVEVFDTLKSTGWIVAMSAYEDDLTATAIRQRNVLAVGGILVAVLLTGIMVLFIRKLIIKPVNGILGYASAVAGGDLGSQLEGEYRFEFEDLSRQIEIMVGELKTKLGFSEGVLKGLTLPCGLIGPDFNMLWVNQSLLDLIERGQEPLEYVGMSAGEFYYRDPAKETLSHRAIREKQALSNESVYATPDGREMNIQVAVTPFYDMDGELLGSLSIWIDMTEIRTQQKMIEEQNARISTAANEAEEISQYLSSTAEELSAQIEQATRGADSQRDRATETAAAMEEMNATVLEVAQNASRAAEDADSAKSHAQSGESVVSQVIESVGDVQSQAETLKVSMEELGIQAADIGKVLEVITDIADQTNLLALNAAIEAARAGEAGRGFAVVADEVRKLAEKTMAATSEVGEAIGKIQSMTTDNVAATEKAAVSVSRSTELAENSGEALREIVGRVEDAVDQVRAIATASEEQSATSEEINRATDEINRISQESSQVMSEASQAIQEVAEMASRLNSVIESMAAK